MKSILIILFTVVLCGSLNSVAAPNAAVICEVLSEVQGVSQPNEQHQLQISSLGNCESKVGEFKIGTTPIKFGFGYVADCQRATNAYPEHLTSLNLSGPKNSSVYASAFSMGGLPKTQSLQLITSLNGTTYNIVVHCKITR